MAQSGIELRMVVPPAPWTRALEDGSVTIPGVSWQTNSDIEFAPERFIVSGAADVGENGVRRLVIDILKGSKSRAIPVYFGRELMQRNLVVRADSSFHHPKDLVGKRIGSRLTIQSGTGAAVLMVLEQAFDLDLKSIDWWMGDPKDLPVNRMNLTMHQAPETDDENYAMLMRGELDAVMQTTGPRYRSMFGGFGDHVDNDLANHPGMRPLITDPQVMADAYKRSGLYPISDVTTIKPEIVEQHPALAKQLVDAFSQANAKASQYRSAEEQALAEREVQLLGEDPHQYGMGDNQRKNIASFIDFLYRLGAIEKAVSPEEIFYPSSL